ncbi:Acidic mammalian chitinase [Harpegnathos saltator]|uniref:chitinase n=1 Tax=Harpegnathos saltator TaxID=610380 RepID=E2C8C7_HARSA|nr:Acidic mammalian chitinase [Harpegnathos saltator]
MTIAQRCETPWEGRSVPREFYKWKSKSGIHRIAERRIVCYYTNWSVYRPGTAKFSPQNINPYLCTHLIYAFGGFTKDNALKPFDKYQDIEKGGYAKFTGLKTYNKNLKTMLAIGGWNEGSSRFSPMVADPAKRREFVKNTVKFLRQNHFDGLDLDWEYPAFRDGGKPRDKDNYANLVQELRDEFEREASKTGRPRLLLSMAMPAGIEYIDKGYDVPRLNDYLDFVNLLSYDYHSAYEPAVNHHSPLYPLEEDNEYNYDAELTIDHTISHLLEKGASADKIVLGIPTYGRSYTLFNQDATELGSPADGPGVEGEATREKGYLAYYEICEGITDSDEWEVIQPNPNAMGPYAFKGDQWVGYDDEDIVKLKARYVNEKKLGGIMFWSIDNDDFRGKCHGRPYPLIEAAKEALLTNNRNTIDKIKSVDSRKKTRNQTGQSNSLSRKFTSSSRRSTTTAAPTARKRVSSARTKYRTITRPKASYEEQEDREVSRRSYEPSSDEDIEGRNTVRVTEKIERPKNRSRSKTRSGSAGSSRRKQSRRKGQTKADDGESLSNKLTTPEPPTTPDPGTDFKCEDEGFFSHPRDCKKYFWCLDSGPGGLGVVAHQFTCPSGLVFNKAADSCDYPRNVICPKSKTSVVSTTRSPITAATSRTTYLHSTTTATAEAEEEQEEEYSEEDYEDDEGEIEESEEKEMKEEPRSTTTAKPLVYKTLTRNRLSTTTTSRPSEQEKAVNNEDEEDPRVIKELIDLIKKAGEYFEYFFTLLFLRNVQARPGGIEQLEKQLLLQEKNSDTTSGSVSVTPAAISRSLYERVLNRQANKIASQRPVLSSSETSYVNGPGRAQFEGLDDIPEVKSLRRSQKHQYVTIERPKSNRKESTLGNEDNDDEVEEEEDDNAETAFTEEQSVSNPLEGSSSTQRVTPNYVNIRRARPSTTTSRNENDVGEKEAEVEEGRPTRRRRPSFFSKQQDNEANSETSKPSRVQGSVFRNSEKDDGSEDADQSAEKDDGSSTTKSRYVSIQRFRSTTSKIPENLPSVITSLSKPTSETTAATRAEEYPEVSSTPASTTTSSSTTVTPTTSTSTEVITVISVESSDNPSSSVSPAIDAAIYSTTTEPVKLVEDSATEILLTTVPASSSTSQLATTTTASRSTIAAVSQPRPFGFTRRRPGGSSETTTPSSNQARPKVSISSRNLTRSSSPYVGRVRLRTRPTNGVRVAEDEPVEQLDAPRTETHTFRSKDTSRPRIRGSNRYTPPTYRSRTEDTSANPVPGRYRDRNRATTTTTSSTASGGAFRRRYRRPSRTESTKVNELDDSPIVRITQGGSKRNPSSRSRSESNDDENNEKVTNIRVFRRPATVNRDLYDRSKYTKKRNNVDSESESARKANDDSNQKRAVSTATTLKIVDEQTTVELDKVERSDLSNVVDQENDVTTLATTRLESQEEATTVDSAVESNTIEPSTYTVQPNAEIDVTTVFSDKVDYTSDRPEDAIATTTSQVESHEFNPDLVTIVSTEHASFDSASEAPRRRKVILRRRPVSSTAANVVEVEEEEQKSSQVTRRRKVIRRIRPISDTSSPISAEVILEEAQDTSNPFPESTTPMNSHKDAEESTITTGQSTITSQMEDSTLAGITETTLSTDDNVDGFAKVILETPVPESTTSSDDEGITDFLSTAESTIDNGAVDQEYRSTSEIGTEATTVESTLATASADLTESDVFLEETLSSTESDDLSTVHTQTTSTLSEADSSQVTKPSFETRYARKKFIRKNPVSSTGNTTNRYPLAPSSAETNSQEVLSKRRSNLFIRRYPVSSTSFPSTLREDLKYKEVENDSRDLEVGQEELTEDTTSRSHSVSNEPASTSAVLRDDSAEFWRRYTPSSSTASRSYLLDHIEDLEDRATGATEVADRSTHPSTLSTNQRLEIRPRYKVPVVLKRPFDPEEALSPRRFHLLDSAPEESEDTPETKDARLKQSSFRQPRTRYRLLERGHVKVEEATVTDTTLPELTTWQYFRTRSYSKRPSIATTTEAAVTETLIPAKKFDYAADAVHRKQQSLRTTKPALRSGDSLYDSNLVDYASTTTAKPLVTRLVTSVVESGTTERQKILIKTKYSSLTSTTRVPADHFLSTTSTSFSVPSSGPSADDDDESVNEIRPGVERSTLPIEGEFSNRYGRFTTESHESSTIEIESVFSNLIADKSSAK